MAYTFDISGSQINGARDYQEDAFLVTHINDGDDAGGKASLVVVADGMGGHAAGNVASNMAVQTFNKHVTSHFPNDKLYQVLNDAAVAANHSITETIRETAALKGMGCTIVGALLADKYLRWVSVGDSHLYLLRAKQLVKKNASHNYGAFLDRMAAAGKPVQPEAGLSRNMLMSALTGEEIAEIDCPETPLELQAGDRVIVSSDGLDSLNAAKITAYCEGAKTAKECVSALLKGVEEAKFPRQDNTTVVVIDVLAAKETKAAAPAPAVERTLTDTQRTAPTQPRAAAAPPPVADETPKSNLGLIAAGIAAVVALAGGGAWFLMSGAPPEKTAVAPAAPPVAEPQPVTETAPPPVAEAPAGEPPAEPAAEPVAGGTPEPTAAIAPAETAPAEVAPSEPVAPAATATPVTAGEEFRDKLKSGSDGPAMLWIQAGSFEMGSPNFAKYIDERPQHKVQVKKFAMSKYEVTIAEYMAFAKATGRPLPEQAASNPDAIPVTDVTWEDALYYTRWLSEQTGFKYRLPSEAEWEYAAAAGTDPYHWWWGREPIAGVAHCFMDCGSPYDDRKPTRIGSFKPNPFGLYDTAGNVAEWVYDCYHKDYQGAPTDGSVWEGGDCTMHVVRGGSFGNPLKSLRSANRDKYRAEKGSDKIGIRVVRDP
jgi:formylglycine-generating enzyme required for sulfatase activity/serine/threonine protein phosphatase PrpC